MSNDERIADVEKPTAKRLRLIAQGCVATLGSRCQNNRVRTPQGFRHDMNSKPCHNHYQT